MLSQAANISRTDKLFWFDPRRIGFETLNSVSLNIGKPYQFYYYAKENKCENIGFFGGSKNQISATVTQIEEKMKKSLGKDSLPDFCYLELWCTSRPGVCRIILKA